MVGLWLVGLAVVGLAEVGLAVEGLTVEGLAVDGLAVEGLAVEGLTDTGLAVVGLAVGPSVVAPPAMVPAPMHTKRSASSTTLPAALCVRTVTPLSIWPPANLNSPRVKNESSGCTRWFTNTKSSSLACVMVYGTRSARVELATQKMRTSYRPVDSNVWFKKQEK